MFNAYSENHFKGFRADDPEDRRLGDRVQCVQDSFNIFLEKVQKGDYVVLGYPDDRGVERNNGRLGASDGPEELRYALYRMVDPLASDSTRQIWDLGNFQSWSAPLLEAHDQAKEMIHQLRRRDVRIISIGGGHDWAYSDYADLGAREDKSLWQLINVDAHLDMRPIPQIPDKQGHSGTPFRRLIQEYQGNPKLFAVGMQRHCNSASHMSWAQSQKCDVLSLEEMPINAEQQWEILIQRSRVLDPGIASVALSIDLDAFDASHAPGVSAPQAFGLDANLVRQLIRESGKKLKHLGLYELNPRFDVDKRTARLAACLIHDFISE